MEFTRLSREHWPGLKQLQIAYKIEIGEEPPREENLESLLAAMVRQQILFYGCVEEGRLIACCSVSPVFSTFDYKTGGVFEDFYILPEYRRRGIARQLVAFAYGESGVSSMTVGCADCDAEMYRALGFRVPLGNMLAFEN